MECRLSCCPGEEEVFNLLVPCSSPSDFTTL